MDTYSRCGERKGKGRKSPRSKNKITRAIQNNLMTHGMENGGGKHRKRKIAPSLDLKGKRRAMKEIQRGQRLRVLS